METLPPVSAWAIERFGQLADDARASVVNALIDTQMHASQAHAGSKTSTNHVWGIARYYGQFERFAELVGALDGARFVRPRGCSFHLVVVGGNLLVPFRFADNLNVNVTEATVPLPVSKWIREAFERFGGLAGPGQEALFSNADLGMSQAPVRTALDHVDPDTRLVLIPYACNAHAGLLAAWWGEAALQEDGTLKWAPNMLEPLPVSSPDRAGSATLRNVAPPDAGSVQRFDDGDVPGLEFPRRAPGTVPSSEEDQPEPEAEGNEQP